MKSNTNKVEAKITPTLNLTSTVKKGGMDKNPADLATLKISILSECVTSYGRSSICDVILTF